MDQLETLKQQKEVYKELYISGKINFIEFVVAFDEINEQIRKLEEECYLQEVDKLKGYQKMKKELYFHWNKIKEFEKTLEEQKGV